MKADIVVKGIIYNRVLKKILLVQRCGSDDIGANTWENAGGNVEYDEAPEEAMMREIREETGLTDVNIRRVAYVTLVNADNPYLIIAYLCEVTTDEVKLSAEHQAYVWADRTEAIEKLPKAIIDDLESNKIFDEIER